MLLPLQKLALTLKVPPGTVGCPFLLGGVVFSNPTKPNSLSNEQPLCSPLLLSLFAFPHNLCHGGVALLSIPSYSTKLICAILSNVERKLNS
jgi:hypothetical protein